MAYVPNQTLPLATTLGGGGHFWEQTARVTWQINAKNKLGMYYNNKKRTYTNGVTTTANEALNSTYFFNTDTYQFMLSPFCAGHAGYRIEQPRS